MRAYGVREDDGGILRLKGPEDNIFKDETTESWYATVKGAILSATEKQTLDPYLDVFLKAMKYLWPFFPQKANHAPHEPPIVPFEVTVTRGQTDFRYTCSCS